MTWTPHDPSCQCCAMRRWQDVATSADPWANDPDRMTRREAYLF